MGKQIDGETTETVTDFFWGGSKITTDGDCSHEIKRCLLLGRKVMTNLDSILKSREGHYFAYWGPSSQSFGFSSGRVWIGEGSGTPLQYSCLENPMDRVAWCAAVRGIAKNWTRLRDFTFHFHALEKEMATHCSVLAWRIPGTVEPGGLSSMGSHRVGHDWSDLAAAAAAGSRVVLS